MITLGIPLWGWFHVIVSLIVGSFHVIEKQKKKRKKGTIIMIVSGIPLWGPFPVVMTLIVCVFPVKT